MAVKIRYAKTPDLDAVLDLWWELHHFHIKDLKLGMTFEYAPDAAEKLRKHYLESLLPQNRVVVADDNGKLVGFCEFGAFSRPPIYKDPKILKVWALYVVPAYRSKGIGKKLLKEVDAVRKLAQMKELEISAHVKNENAIAFYSSLGFQKRMVDMVKR